MKKIYLSIAAIALLAAIVVGCSATPPTKVEQALFTSITNYYSVPVVVPVKVTNTVEAVVLVTNTQNVVVTQTNFVPQVITTYQTNLVVKEDYTQTVSQSTKDAVTGISTLVNYVAPGTGGIVGLAALLLLNGWTWLRSSKRAAVNNTLAQEIETMRQFIISLPNGTAYDTAITSWLQSHQLETGTADSVLTILENQISNPNAVAALKQIQAALQAATMKP